MNGNYILEVLNPRNTRKIEDFQGLSAPRITTLDGKRVALFREKPDSDLLLKPLQKLLQEKYPTSTFDCYQIRQMMPESDIEILRDYDAFIFGVRNTGGTDSEPAVAYEKAGIPGVHICIDSMSYGQSLRSAFVSGLPTIRMAVLSAEEWFAAANIPENFISIAEGAIDKIIHAMTDPLTDDEKNPKFPEYDFSNLRFNGENYSDAFDKFQSYFLENEFSDGIAVAPPTPEAVKNMLTGTKRKPDEVLPGMMQPGRGIVTIEKIAVNAVMAGAKPEYMPIIITAVEMLCSNEFYTWHLFASMNSTNLFIAIGGPIAKELGINGDEGYIGPGNRANNSIGRAISLCALNLGWVDFNIDGGMMGQPSRFCNIVFCENEEMSPWESYSVSRGFSSGDSTVLIEEVFHIDGMFWKAIDNLPSGVWTYGLQADLDRLAEMAQGHKVSLDLVSKGIADIHLFDTLQKDPLPMINGRTYALILYPGQARRLAAAGFTRETLARYIGDRYRIPWVEFDSELQENILKLAEKGVIPGLSVNDCKNGGTIPVMNTSRLAIFVAGPMSGQTLGLTCMGSYSGYLRASGVKDPTKPPFYIKKVTGATLTKAGR